MAATLAGVCQVPLTAALLLFELTQDYRIVLPLLGAVGFSAWITSDKKTRRRATDNSKELKDGSSTTASQEENSTSREPSGSSICELENSLCLNSDSEDDAENLVAEILVSQAMRTRYVTASMSSSLADVVSLMLEEKQSCASVVDDHDCLVAQLTLADIQQFSMARIRKPQVGGFCTLLCYYKSR